MADHAAIARRTLALLYGIVCHALFAAGVGMMIVAMYSGMSRTFGRLVPPWNFIVNGILLLQFPLMHSLLLARRGRPLLKWLAPRDIAENLAPTNFVIIAAFQTLLLFSLWTPSGIVWWQAQGPLHLMLTLLYAASWLLLARAIYDAGAGLQTGAIGWWAVLRNRRPRYPPMPRHGLFRLCRQPIYLAFVLTLWTVPVWTPDQLAVALVLTAYCLTGPLLKERRFVRLFGEEFESYRASRPYLLPWPHGTVRRNDLTLYDRYADAWWIGRTRWLRTLHNLVPARLAYFNGVTGWTGKQVLDLGCGGGFMAEALARRGAIVTGVDPAAGAIAAARRHAAEGGLDIRYEVGRGEQLPFAAGTFDIVVCVDVFEHVGDLDAVLAEIARVLKPGGLLLFDTINRTWLASFVIVALAERVLRLLPRGTHDPAKFIAPGELAANLAAHGFTMSEPVGLGPTGLNRRGDIVFGPLPTTAIMYLGHARRDAE